MRRKIKEKEMNCTRRAKSESYMILAYKEEMPVPKNGLQYRNNNDESTAEMV